MIRTLAFLGAPILLAVWLAGLPGVWRGQPKVSVWASVVGIALGLVCAVSGMFGPRYSNFWMGDAGNGDGFGLIGLFLYGGMLAGAAFVLLVVAAVIASIRSNRSIEEVPE